MFDQIITSDRDDIREAAAMSFTGNLMLKDGRTVSGHVTPCDVVGSTRTGIFTDVTVTSRSGRSFRRVPLAMIQIVEIWDI